MKPSLTAITLAVIFCLAKPSAWAEEEHSVATALSQTTLSGVVDTSAVWAFGAPTETILFQDNFDTDNSANWDVLNGSNSGTPDFSVDWAFDYSNTTYTSNGVALKIPPAPTSTNTTRGVKVAVNKLDQVAEAAAVNLYPKGRSFSNNFALRFDMWINYNGGEYGGTGSTEFGIFGLNHSGTFANWSPPAANASAVPASDGVWYGVTGEAGAARDYRNYEGDPAGPPLEYTGLTGGFLDRDGDGTVEQEAVSTTAADYPLDVIYSRPPQETRGVPGKKWVRVEIRQLNDVITWVMDGYVISEKQNQSAWTSGNVMIGTMDNFNSIAVPGADNFVIFDNVRVVDLGNSPALPRLTLAATQASASEPSTNGSFTITRTGDTAAALSFNLGIRGTATSGSDFAAIPLTTNFPAGASTLEIPVTVINDQRAEPAETVKLHLVSNPGQYEVFAPMIGTVEIADDNDLTAVSVTAVDPWAYEGIPSDVGSFRLSRVGDVTADLTVNYTVSGTAQSGVDFQAIGSSAVIPAGVESVFVNVVPINNTTADESRTVTLQLATGTGYILGATTNGTVTIRNDDGAAPGTVVYGDNFDTDTSAQWTVNQAHPDSNQATFNFDYSTVGIPPAPHTTNATTRGLKLEANIGAPTFTGLSVSPTGKGFEGDYRLSFDMWINYNGPLPAGGTGSTLSFAAGVGTSGTLAQFPGTSVEGVLFSVTGDGGSGTDWRAYVATGAALPTNSGAYAAGMHSTVLNNTDPYYAPFGRAAAPEAQLAIYPEQTGLVSAGAPGMAWHEVSIERRGTNISWFVDNLRISTITLTNKEISTNIFVGFFDINATQTGNQDLSFGLVDNLRVEQLDAVQPPGEIRISGITRSNATVQILFSAPASVQNPVIEGSATITVGFGPEPNVQLENIGVGAGGSIWRATIPITTPNRFFRVRQ